MQQLKRKIRIPLIDLLRVLSPPEGGTIKHYSKYLDTIAAQHGVTGEQLEHALRSGNWTVKGRDDSA